MVRKQTEHMVISSQLSLFRKVSALASGLFLGLFFIIFGATSASAHTDLVSSNPSAGSTILSTETPDTISLTFSEPPLLEGSAIVVANEDGSQATTLDATLEGATLSVPWPTDLKAGKATVTWRIAADDGHVLTDEFSFTVEQVIDVVGETSPTTVPVVIASAPTSESNEANEAADAGMTVLWGLFTFLVTIGVGMWIRKRKESK